MFLDSRSSAARIRSTPHAEITCSAKGAGAVLGHSASMQSASETLRNWIDSRNPCAACESAVQVCSTSHAALCVPRRLVSMRCTFLVASMAKLSELKIPMPLQPRMLSAALS